MRVISLGRVVCQKNNLPIAFLQIQQPMIKQQLQSPQTPLPLQKPTNQLLSKANIRTGLNQMRFYRTRMIPQLARQVFPSFWLEP